MNNNEFEEFKEYVNHALESIYSKIDEEDKLFLSFVVNKFNILSKRVSDAIDYGISIDNRTDFMDIMELRHLINILQGEE